MKKIFIMISIMFFMSGCGLVAKTVSSEDSYLDKAEFAVGIKKENLSLVPGSITSAIDSVHFSIADKNNNLYKCYYTTIMSVIDSDAVCTKIRNDGSEDKIGTVPNCNALLKAAGKC
ncbi:MAG: hypothetical protein ACI4V7_08980 [Succinivibrionaceae bacterium]